MFNKRASNIAPSATLKFSSAAKSLKAQGADMVSLGMGEPDYGTPAHIIEAAKRAMDEGFTHYTPVPGIPELREAIARKSREENGIPAEAKHVLVTPTKMAVFLAIQVLVDQGDEVLLPDPAWVSYDPCIGYAGGKTVWVPLDRERGFSLDLEAIKEAITPATKAIIINSPSNPTGGVFERSELQALADIAIDNDLWVITDEIYEKLVYDAEHHSIASLPGMFERTITLNGFSKAYAMTGWRLGWLTAPEDALKLIQRLQGHSLTCCTSFAQKAGIEALEGDQGPLEGMRKEFRARRDLFVRGLNAIDGVKCPTPQGAFYTFPHFDVDLSSEELTMHLLEKAHVAGTPGSGFGANGEGHIRFSYAASRETIQKGIDRIGEAMAGL